MAWQLSSSEDDNVQLETHLQFSGASLVDRRTGAQRDDALESQKAECGVPCDCSYSYDIQWPASSSANTSTCLTPSRLETHATQ